MSRVTLGDVARESKKTLKNYNSNFPIVGLEHLDPGEINLTRWSKEESNTFRKVFSRGQVLFGRRRAYLRKAVLAPFEGLCSGDITVIEALPQVILPELLPFVVQNDTFFDYALKKSSGSMSPRVKWDYLSLYEFNLPKIDEQKAAADVLWKITNLRAKYKELIQSCDDLTKSQFVNDFKLEMN